VARDTPTTASTNNKTRNDAMAHKTTVTREQAPNSSNNNSAGAEKQQQQESGQREQGSERNERSSARQRAKKRRKNAKINSSANTTPLHSEHSPLFSVSANNSPPHRLVLLHSLASTCVMMIRHWSSVVLLVATVAFVAFEAVCSQSRFDSASMVVSRRKRSRVS
jgi:hypothetical protein